MNTTYTPVAKGLHWLMAVMILGLLALGIYMHELPLSPQKLELYSWHKWFGVTAFLLVLVRLGWRVTHIPPALPTSMPKLMQFAAHAGHFLLYALMLAIPLTGWLMSSAKGFTTNYFGLFDLPNLIDKDKALAATLKEAHGFLANSLMALVGLHIAAAMKHQLIDKDNLMARMRLPRQRK